MVKEARSEGQGHTTVENPMQEESVRTLLPMLSRFVNGHGDCGVSLSRIDRGNR